MCSVAWLYSCPINHFKTAGVIFMLADTSFWNKHFINLFRFSNIWSFCVVLDLYSRSKMFPLILSCQFLYVNTTLHVFLQLWESLASLKFIYSFQVILCNIYLSRLVPVSSGMCFTRENRPRQQQCFKCLTLSSPRAVKNMHVIINQTLLPFFGFLEIILLQMVSSTRYCVSHITPRLYNYWKFFNQDLKWPTII